MYDIEDLCKAYQRARDTRQIWESVWQECYDYALPGRLGFTNKTRDPNVYDRLFDTTAVDALAEFATNLQFGLTAPMSKSIELIPDVDLDDEQRYAVKQELDGLRDMILQALDDARADIADPETFADCGCVGTGHQLIPEREGQWPPFEVMPVAAAEVWLMPGPFGQPAGWIRAQTALYRDLAVEYPEAAWGKVTQKQSAAQLEKLELTVVEATYRDFDETGSETYRYCVFIEQGQVELEKHSFVGMGAAPWVTARWTGAAGDFYGRPPMLAALPLAKVLNLSTQLILENAEMALSGMWQYEGSDVVNINQITLAPGTIIPKVPGTAGLEPLRTDHGRFDVGQMITTQHQQAIRQIFFNVDLGPMDKTPMSAEEARTRKGKALQRMGSSYLRLKGEFVERRAHRVLYLLVKNGFAKEPSIGRENVRVRVISPLQRSVSMEEVERVSGYIGTVAGLYGPKMALLLSNPAAIAQRLAENFQLPAGLTPTPAEVRKQLQQLVGGVAQQEAAAPGSGQALIDAAAQVLPNG